LPKYLLTNEVIATGLWKMLETNPAYSEDLTTKAKVGKSAACTYFTFQPGTTVSTASDFPDISSRKYGWRTESPISGKIQAGVWTFRVRLENDTKYAFSVKVACRVSISSYSDGSNAKLIGVYESPNVLALPAAAGGSVSDTWSASLPEITMLNEYLFVEFRIHIEVAGTSTLCQCSFACDENPAVADESITTPDIIPHVPAPNWLYGFSYRKEHLIHPAANAGTKYPIKVVVHYGTGTDAGSDVYLGGKCKTDFSDIRFTGSDGITLLNFWRERYADSDYAVFWVEVADDLSSTEQSIYIYYGNPAATRADNPQNIDIFSLREHQAFSGYYPNFSFSKPTDTVIRIDSYTAGASSMGEGYIFIILPKDLLHGKKVRIYWNLYFSYSTNADYSIGKLYVLDTELWRGQSLSINYLTKIFPSKEATHYPGPLGLPAGWLGWRLDESDILDLSSFTSPYVTLAIIASDAWQYQTVMLDVDYLEILDAQGNVLYRYDFDKAVVMEVTGTYEDYGLYRKYVSPEPINGGWGSEETAPPIAPVPKAPDFLIIPVLVDGMDVNRVPPFKVFGYKLPVKVDELDVSKFKDLHGSDFPRVLAFVNSTVVTKKPQNS